MSKLIRSDGNGCLVVSKYVGMLIAILTLTSIIWGMATSYAMKTDIRPVAADVLQLKIRTERLEQSHSDQKVQLARLESKIDILIDQGKGK